ncbi:MAG: hypothetical protein ACYSUY_02600 [Planctomycetota bacterium]|jgi:hypothetical protein
MDMKKHCGLLTKFKNDGMKLSTYMGRRWFVSKMMLIILAMVLLFLTEKTFRIAGFIVLGYIIGVIVANFRSYFLVKKKWKLQKELIDWEKVREYLGTSE